MLRKLLINDYAFAIGIALLLIGLLTWFRR